MIKFRLGDYEIEINAVNKCLKDHENDTLYLLNQLSIISGLAADVMYVKGYKGIADGYNVFQNDFYKVCKENGLYDEVKK